jgi:hypothetical protein
MGEMIEETKKVNVTCPTANVYFDDNDDGHDVYYL